jgi:4-alpha-glucanotransferase
VTSLPGPFGIGDLGPVAHRWIDQLVGAGQTWWQILPLGPTGEGNSPYGSLSAFAGNPDLISPESLWADGIVSRSDLAGARFATGRVNYPRAGHFKQTLLRKAWENFRDGRHAKLAAAFNRFRAGHRGWLPDFTRFMAMRELYDGRAWTDWPEDFRSRNKSGLRDIDQALGEPIDRHAFIQFLFDRQLQSLRRYAKENGVHLIGDMPMFVAADSADVWANPHLFQLDAHGRPKVVAGVPPDYFSRTGQRWGNPIYNWRAMRRNGFQWWIDRIRAALRQVDLLRIDHFRGLEACWEIPATSPTAQKGKWVKAPGAALLETLRNHLGGLPFIAEDLGVITPEVEKLRDDFGLPGMRVLQFAFGGGPDNLFLPHNYPRHAVVYTGTHDNDTVVGWFRSLPKHERARVLQFTCGNPSHIASDMIRLAWSSVASIAIAPLQDVLGLGSPARMNIPGKAEGNWTWRLGSLDEASRGLDRLRNMTAQYDRAHAPR